MVTEEQMDKARKYYVATQCAIKLALLGYKSVELKQWLNSLQDDCENLEECLKELEY